MSIVSSRSLISLINLVNVGLYIDLEKIIISNIWVVVMTLNFLGSDSIIYIFVYGGIFSFVLVLDLALESMLHARHFGISLMLLISAGVKFGNSKIRIHCWLKIEFIMRFILEHFFPTPGYPQNILVLLVMCLFFLLSIMCLSEDVSV